MANARKIEYAQQAYFRIHENEKCPADINGVCCEKCQIAFQSFSEAFDAIPKWMIAIAMTETFVYHPIRIIKAGISAFRDRIRYKRNISRNIPRKGSENE